MASNFTYRATPSGDVAHDANFRGISTALDAVTRAPLCIPGAVEMTVELASGDNRVNHGLPVARGYLVLRQSAAADLYDEDDDQPGWMVINASTAVTVKLVFLP